MHYANMNHHKNKSVSVCMAHTISSLKKIVAPLYLLGFEAVLAKSVKLFTHVLRMT